MSEDRFWIGVGAFALLAMGFGRVWSSLRQCVAEREEVEKFAETFNRYRLSHGQDLEAYGSLIERSDRVPRLLGYVGVMAEYVAPFRAFTARNYQIILNGLPTMHRELATGFGRSDHAPIVAESLLRYIGVSTDRIRDKQRELLNPLAWFREGVAGIIFLPVQLLQSLGLVSKTGAVRMAHSVAFRALAGVVALIGLLSSVVTVVQGWRPTMDAIRSFLRAWR